MKKLFVCAAILLSTSALAVSAPAELKKEIELKINLTSGGFTHLRKVFLNDFKGTKSQREDFYFEIFEDSQYRLKKISPPIKLRFMWDGLELKWQVQQTVRAWERATFSFKETIAQSTVLTSMPDFLLSLENYHLKLSTAERSTLDLARTIQEDLYKNNLIKNAGALCNLCAQAKPAKLTFFSSHINSKSRVKVKIKNGQETFTIQVGETINNEVPSYELEAEVKDSGDIEKSANYLGEWLKKSAGFNSELHIETKPSIDPAISSEKKLQELL
jgi:hypothetical protein